MSDIAYSTCPAIIKGRSIAQNHRPPCQRAALAADWLRGGFIFLPTIRQASILHGVSEPLIRAALKGYDKPPMPAIDRLWNWLTPAERAEFIQRHPQTIWSALDLATV